MEYLRCSNIQTVTSTSYSIALGVGCSEGILAERSLPVWLSVFVSLLPTRYLAGSPCTVAGQFIFSYCFYFVGELEFSYILICYHGLC